MIHFCSFVSLTGTHAAGAVGFSRRGPARGAAAAARGPGALDVAAAGAGGPGLGVERFDIEPQSLISQPNDQIL